MAAQLGGINSCSSRADAFISYSSRGVRRSVEDSCDAQESRNGHAPDKRERCDRGLALQLMRTAIEHARMPEGVASLHLCVSDAAPDAQRLYERVGFMTWGVELDAIRVTARSLNDHHMSLTL
jgi:hypothetical protein